MGPTASSQRSIAVTGASGFIGRRLCDHFRRLGWDVRALVRRTSEYPYGEAGVRMFRCDLPEDIDPDGLRGADVLIHCAYMTRFTDLEAARRVNDAGTRRLVALAADAGVPRSLFLSSQSAHEGARSYYGRSKLELERLFPPDRDVVFRSGLVIARTGDGLFHRMCETVKKSKVIPLFGGGRQPIQTLHADDLCRAAQAAVEKGLTGLFTVAEPRALEMRELLRGIAARLHRSPLFVPFPMLPALAALRCIELLRIPFPVSSENLVGMQCLRFVDTTSDLARLGVEARPAVASLDDALGKA
jgi:dihydroflavonol-4-reductase